MPAQPSRKPSSPASGTPVRGQRADARHNRARLLQAAREAYAINGTDVPSSAIARRAGVGAATLYRHFPTRGSLIAAAFSEQLAECVAALDEALQDDDPWRGLCSVLTKVCRMQAEDRGFSAAFLSESPDEPGFRSERARAEAGLARLAQRAKDTGQLRKDFDPSDVVLLLLANNGVVRQSPEVALAASRRLLAYFLQSCRATDGAPPLPRPAPLRLDDLYGPPHRTG
ncbi:putative transcriptional regulator, TetR family protein [Streptomyces bingchenggensis BCW-1]|uniref:Putative transcriptional regulator, TetR family protein n=1 Tax=Streptomyces bingchenggensis (strain BCW-1) TaxID=749414 RepID=D7C7R6_STRBB|nr:MULTISPECIES: TetR/AcrR family transcriptional regulator [Streptomyces]ADI12614.1 putative transcriptional regulator, TetR family protein [Streptomyces bingchenggensis BCW-1]